MAERCPECNAEFGASDAYCTECGTPRRNRVEPRDGVTASDHASWRAPLAENDRVHAPSVSAAVTDSMDDNDFIPLVIPPSPRGSRLERRAIAAVVLGVLLLGALAAAAWFLVGANSDDDDAGSVLDQPNVPAWVAGGSPDAATPQASGAGATPGRVVVDDNAVTATGLPTESLPLLAPGADDGSPPASSTSVASPVVAGASRVIVSAPAATPSPVTVSGTSTSPSTVAATPAPKVAPTPSVPRVSTTVVSTSAAKALAAIAAGIEPAGTPSPEGIAGADGSASPTAPAATSTPAPLPAGDGTGGPRRSE